MVAVHEHHVLVLVGQRSDHGRGYGDPVAHVSGEHQHVRLAGLQATAAPPDVLMHVGDQVEPHGRSGRCLSAP